MKNEEGNKEEAEEEEGNEEEEALHLVLCLAGHCTETATQDEWGETSEEWGGEQGVG